jgi:hypothetical protein
MKLEDLNADFEQAARNTALDFVSYMQGTVYGCTDEKNPGHFPVRKLQIAILGSAIFEDFTRLTKQSGANLPCGPDDDSEWEELVMDCLKNDKRIIPDFRFD